ncbi:MAG: HlyD family efflux transporter periplasmic adaptor subunit, partial [Oscillospiraceae bacterium]
MRSIWTTVIVFILSVLVILLAVGQIFFAGGKKVPSEVALFYGIEEDIPFTGVYLRDETVIPSSGSGIISYEHADGSKVGVSSVIAVRYKSESEIDYRREIGQLQEQITVLENAEKLLGTDDSQLEAISSQINEQHSELVSRIISGDYSGAASLENGMLEALCKREITLRESDGYSEKKAALERRISELESRLSGDVTEICAGGTGYFVSKVDGYEGELSFSDVDSITAERINEIIENPDKSTQNKAVGKLIADYRWRVAAVIDTQSMFGVNKGSKVQLRVGSDASILDAEVVSVTDNGDGTSVFIFECDRLTSSVVQGRTAQFKLVTNSYGGLRVSRSAIRYNENGDRGV